MKQSYDARSNIPPLIVKDNPKEQHLYYTNPLCFTKVKPNGTVDVVINGMEQEVVITNLTSKTKGVRGLIVNPKMMAKAVVLLERNLNYSTGAIRFEVNKIFDTSRMMPIHIRGCITKIEPGNYPVFKIGANVSALYQSLLGTAKISISSLHTLFKHYENKEPQPVSV